MHTCETVSGEDRASQADVDDRLPVVSCRVDLSWSIDRDATWVAGGRLRIPSNNEDAVARMFLVSAMAAPSSAEQTVWQVQAWKIPANAALTADEPPSVTLYTDGALLT
ncbi:hypothetical protein [Nonomuraea sp. NPDC048916]|uniref:hypothetical protein n=1 Tax=Nonomuraea sp. NPDC048916 TaxID=3154232 RepID=UPI0033F3A68D